MSAELDAFHRLELLGKVEPVELFSPSLAKGCAYTARLREATKGLELPDDPAQPQRTRKTLSDEEKVALVREQARALLTERTPFSDRIPLLRARAESCGLTLRDTELQRLLWDERRRAAGSLEPVTPGQRLNLSPTAWLWEGVIMPGRLNLVVALPKVGKTALVLAWIAAWHHSCRSFLDRPLIGPCPPVLVVGTDQPENDWGAMLQRVGLMDDTAQLGEPFVALFHKAAPLHLDPEGIERIARYAADHPNLLIVVDSIAACTGPLGLDENSREIAEPIRDLMEAVAPHSATVVAIHHAAKGRASESATVASRGSTALPAEASQIISLSRMPTPEGEPESPQIVIRTEGRGGSPIKQLIEQTDAGWVSHGDGGAIERRRRLQQVVRKLNDRQAETLDLVRDRWHEHERTDAKTLAGAIGLEGDGGRTGERKARETLDQLTRKGLLVPTVESDRETRRKWYAPHPDLEASLASARVDPKTVPHPSHLSHPEVDRGSETGKKPLRNEDGREGGVGGGVQTPRAWGASHPPPATAFAAGDLVELDTLDGWRKGWRVIELTDGDCAVVGHADKSPGRLTRRLDQLRLCSRVSIGQEDAA